MFFPTDIDPKFKQYLTAIGVIENELKTTKQEINQLKVGTI